MRFMRDGSAWREVSELVGIADEPDRVDPAIRAGIDHDDVVRDADAL